MELTANIKEGVKAGFSGLGSLDLSSRAIPGYSEQSRCANITRFATVTLVSLVSLSALALGLAAIACCGTLISIMSGAAVIAFALLGLAFAVIVLKRMFESRKLEKEPSPDQPIKKTPEAPKKEAAETSGSGDEKGKRIWPFPVFPGTNDVQSDGETAIANAL